MNAWWDSPVGIFDINLGLASPSGPLAFDSSGNIYGTTQGCCGSGGDTVYELAKSGDGLPSILYAFHGGSDGGFPEGGVIFDSSGNLYGTTASCPGTVFKLTPHGSQWSHSTLLELGGVIGQCPVAGLVMTPNGNLYGATASGGAEPPSRARSRAAATLLV